MNIILFKYSPRAVMLNYIPKENTIVIAPSSQKEKYQNFIKEYNFSTQIKFLDDYVFPEILLEIKKIEKNFKITSVTTLSEEDIAEAGILNDYFSKNTSSYLKNTMFKDKYYMRSFLKNIVEQPYFRLIRSKDDISIFWNKTKLDKAIIKPRDAAGSQGVHKIFREMKNLEELSNDIFSGNYIIEEYIELNNMLTCDGYSIGDKIKRMFFHEYDDLLLNSLNKGKEKIIRTSSLYSKNIEILKLAFIECKKVLEIFSLKDEITPFHFEWFYDEINSKVFFCEVGKRFGGGNIPFLVDYSFGINVLQEYWDQLVNGENKDIKKLDKDTLFFPKCLSTSFSPYKKEGVIKYIPDISEFSWTKNTWIFIKEGDVLKTATTIVENLLLSEFISFSEEEYNENLYKLRSIVQKIKYERI